MNTLASTPLREVSAFAIWEFLSGAYTPEASEDKVYLLPRIFELVAMDDDCALGFLCNALLKSYSKPTFLEMDPEEAFVFNNVIYVLILSLLEHEYQHVTLDDIYFMLSESDYDAKPFVEALQTYLAMGRLSDCLVYFIRKESKEYGRLLQQELHIDLRLSEEQRSELLFSEALLDSLLTKEFQQMCQGLLRADEKVAAQSSRLINFAEGHLRRKAIRTRRRAKQD